MPTEIRWIISSRASSLHAASALLAGEELIDQKTAEALAAEAKALGDELDLLGIDSQDFVEHAIPLAAQIEPPLRWAETVLAKTLGPQSVDRSQADRLSRRLVALQAAFDAAHPTALDELELRSAPLREQWEARGGGLLATAGRLTEPRLIVDSADVLLVHPVRGGGGAAHWRYNLVRFEAVLTNPMAHLPEVLRLGWLIAQLSFDLPLVADHLEAHRLAAVGSLALVPPLLAAGEEVELVRNTDESLAAAVSAWTGASADTEQLAAWWQTYEATQPTWPVALRALDEML